MFKRLGPQPGANIFIEGGFAKNKQYCELLAALCPESRIVLTSLPEGTSMGAAILGWMLLTGKDAQAVGEGFSIETRDVPAVVCGGVGRVRGGLSPAVTLAARDVPSSRLRQGGLHDLARI